MHFTIICLMVIVCGCSAFPAWAQPSDTARIKTSSVFEGDRLLGLTRYDERGNSLFLISDDLMGPVTMAFAWRFDSLGRETRSAFAHCNVGCSVTEFTYDANEKRSWSYAEPELSERIAPRGDQARLILVSLRTAEELESLRELRRIRKQRKHLSRIEILDEKGRTLKDISIDKKGDTTGINEHRYAANGDEIYFRFHDPGFGSWEYFTSLDSAGHRVKWARVEDRGGRRDTTELDIYTYGGGNRMIAHHRYLSGKLNYTETYAYDSSGHRNETRAMNASDPERVWLTQWQHNDQGLVVREQHYEVVNGEARLEHDHRLEYEFW